ncbi:hypothetical protein HKD37_06G017173 [Glycine soja]
MSRNTRQSTRLRRLTLRTLGQSKPIVNINAAIGRGSGPHKEKFHSYLGVLAREKIPIVHNNWKDVPKSLKDLVWDDILAKFDIPEAPNAKKKDSLEEQTTQGTFVPHGRDDILNTAIRRSDHGGRVCAAGSGVTITQYYGRTSRASSSSSTSITQQHLAKIIGSLKEEWRNEIKEEVRNEIGEENKQSLKILKQELKEAIIIEMSQKGSQFSPTIKADIHVLGASMSTKGSNAETAVNRSREEHVAHVIPNMGLHVQRQDSTQLVALGKIYEGGPTIHSMAYADDVIRVSVEKVIDSDAEVPLPT